MAQTETLDIRRDGAILYVTLNQPETRNALSVRMVTELHDMAWECERDAAVRCVVLRGAGGNFCAGGNFSDFQQMMQSPLPTNGRDPIAVANREFGSLLQALQALPQALIAVVEGAAMGGGMGLAAVADIVLADERAQFAMPEASLGLPPAQIAPFVAQRIGTTHTRRLALTAARFNAVQAQALNLVDEVVPDGAALEAALQKTLAAILRCAPRAIASTKAILARGEKMDATLDFAAAEFALALRSGDAAEGVRAFVEKRPAAWAMQTG